MFRRVFFFILWVTAGFLVAVPTKTHAADFSLPIESEENYFWRLLAAALEAADGNHTLSRYQLPKGIPQTRVVRAMLDESAPYTVIFTGHNKNREQDLIQIDVPLTRGLFGYRVFVIRRQDTNLFANIHSLEGLTSRITLGSGSSWPDTKILRSAGFTVVTSNRDTLWTMLARERFIAFPRSIFEVATELNARGNSVQGQPVTIEDRIMLYYPFDVFFYLAPTDTERAAILAQGMDRIYKNGTFLRIFNSDPQIKAALRNAAAQNRKIFTLENPLNSERINKIPAKYWHHISDK
jgi:hypothetical protein